MSDVIIQISRRPGMDDVPLPRYQTEHAAGMDVCAAVEEPLTLEPGGREAVPTGLYLAIPMGYEAQIRPRSGLALKHGITLANSPGTIDADYRGELKVLVVNLGQEPFTVSRGMRIAQMVVAPVTRAKLEVVEALPESTRGDGGFGHTGTH